MKVAALLVVATTAVAHPRWSQDLHCWSPSVAERGGFLLWLPHYPDARLDRGPLRRQRQVDLDWLALLSGAKDGERIAVKKETRHPKYAADLITYDYNIIELASPSKFTSVKLYAADTETFVVANATVVGWGTTSSGGKQSNELLGVNVPVVSDADCKAARLQGAPISETMFCAGGEKNKDSCQGDLGGPIVLQQETGDALIGIVSWGEGCGRVGKPGVYAKVSFAKDWVLSLALGAEFI